MAEILSRNPSNPAYCKLRHGLMYFFEALSKYASAKYSMSQETKA
jgi:hypothetical protein